MTQGRHVKYPNAYFARRGLFSLEVPDSSNSSLAAPTMKTLQQIEPQIDLQNAPASAVDTNNASYHFIINQPGSYYPSANPGVTKANGIVQESHQFSPRSRRRERRAARSQTSTWPSGPAPARRWPSGLNARARRRGAV